MDIPAGSGAGVYRRRILITSPDDSTVEAALEDDFHHFRLTLLHDGSAVTGVVGHAVRYPWTACAEAVSPLTALDGMPLEVRASSVGGWADARANCTHLFDLAGLAVAAAARGTDRVQYDILVPDRDDSQVTRPRLFRDGELVLSWTLEGSVIVGPAMFEGVPLRGGFMRWAETHLDPETAEAAIVLRRSCEIAWGRLEPWDQWATAAEVGEFMLGACHTFQPERAGTALRVRGTVRDFTDHPELLLSGE